MDSRPDKYVAGGRPSRADTKNGRLEDQEKNARWSREFYGLLKVGFPTLIAAAAATAAVYGPSAVAF